MKFLNKLERRFGKYAIHNLMRYVIAMYVGGFVLGLIGNAYKVDFYYNFLSLDISKVLQGQVWRLFTFILQPPSMSFWVLIMLYMYYMIGTSLERAWGAFRFNLYFLSGIIFNIIAAFLIYFVTLLTPNAVYAPYTDSISYINQTMFLAFATLFPNMQFLLFFFLPIKVKYLGWFYAALLAYQVIVLLGAGLLHGDIESISQGIAIIISLMNFLIYFASTRNYHRYSPASIKRKTAFRRDIRQAGREGGKVVNFNGKSVITRHKCAVCGRTELDDDTLEFRFCSKCEGNYEYCSDHLYTHEHVHKK